VAGQRISGIALGSIAAGTVFVFAGIKGYSVAQTLQVIISGKDPRQQAQANPIGGTPLTAPGIPGGIGSLGNGSGAAIAQDALRYKGAGYVWAGKPAQGIGIWDCSSFSNWVIGHDNGLAIPGWGAGKYDGSTHGPPTMIWLAWAGCTTVGHDGNQAQAGDLAIWQTHMGICVGPNQMISAQSSATGTQVSAINGFIPEVLFIRRLKAVEASTATIASAGPH
jgi:cell wall-associated NlpC family hydrolase